MKVLHSDLLQLKDWVEVQLNRFELEEETDTAIGGKEAILNIFNEHINGLTTISQLGQTITSVDVPVMVELFRDQLNNANILRPPPRKLPELAILSKQLKDNPEMLTINPPPAFDPDRLIYDKFIQRMANNTSQALQFRGLMMGEKGIREATGNFDIIHLRNILGYVSNTKYFLSTCYKSLKPGGKLLITEYDYNREGIKDELKVNVFNLMNILSVNIFTQTLENPDYEIIVPYVPLTKIEIQKLLLNNNFESATSYKPITRYVHGPGGVRLFEATKPN